MIPMPQIIYLKFNTVLKQFLELTEGEVERILPGKVKIAHDMIDDALSKAPDKPGNRRQLETMWVVVDFDTEWLKIFNVDPRSPEFAEVFPDVKWDAEETEDFCESPDETAPYNHEDCETCKFKDICPLYREMMDIDRYELSCQCKAGRCDNCEYQRLCPKFLSIPRLGLN